jgi:hypothetical protein
MPAPFVAIINRAKPAASTAPFAHVVIVDRPGMEIIAAACAASAAAEAARARVSYAYAAKFTRTAELPVRFPFYVFDCDQHGSKHEFIQTEREVVDRLRAMQRHPGDRYAYALVWRVDAPFVAPMPGGDGLSNLPRAIVGNDALDAILKSGRLNLS